jgi:tetratricopeptide (TPR) repeat protein
MHLPFSRSLLWLPPAVLLLLAGAVAWIVFSPSKPAPVPGPTKPAGPIPVDAEPAKQIDANYVGTAKCAECHSKEMQAWEGSHHDRAMEVPSPKTVEGDFSDTTFTKEGVTSRFFKKDDAFYVRTEGEDGQMHDYKVQYVFGVYPLQQYLVKFPGGRLQTLPLCWDNRPKEQGGQRWFHIYPDERIKPDDPLFWTRSLQNWNTQCAECHSTNLKKNYDPKQDRYHTSFANIDVSCEACHGPGSRHVQWAKAEEGWSSALSYAKARRDAESANGSSSTQQSFTEKGLTVKLKPDEPYSWGLDPDTGQPKRSRPLQDRVIMQVCSRCHARRSVTSEKFVPGDDWLQTHRPTLLEQPLYHADGRIEEEVYVWGSFRQSKMYHKGVRCTDCHDPHTLDLQMPKQQLCLKCHSAGQYDTPDHHFHKPQSKGASCVSCHMPEETYMVVDPRSDHSFRVPRPDRSLKLGTPNTCNDCHDDQTTQWAVKHYNKWWGEPETKDKPYAYALDAAQKGDPTAGEQLNQAARNQDNTAIARATALARLQNYPSRRSLQTITNLIEADDPLLRMGAARALQPFPASQKWSVGVTALDDPSRMVRTEAARALAGAPKTLPGPRQSKDFENALGELQVAHRLNADRASAMVSEGNVQLSLENRQKAIEAYQAAMARNPHFASAYANLADVYRRQNSEQDVQRVLEQGLKHSPKAPALHYALALSLVRQQKTDQAITSLKKALEYGQGNAQYAYMLAIAYNSTGRPQPALDTLTDALQEHPRNAQLLQAMATIARDDGQYAKALNAAKRLVELAPGNRRYQGLLRQIQQMAE